MRWNQGQVATLPVEFRDYNGGLTDPSDPRIDIHDSAGVKVVDNMPLTRLDTGLYQYQYVIPFTSPTGLWRYDGKGMILGQLVAAQDYFEVEAAVAPEVPFGTAEDSIWISQYADNERIGVLIHRGGALADPDNDSVTATFTPEGGNISVFSRACVRDSVGAYHIIIGSADDRSIGRYLLTFDFSFDGVPAAPIIIVVDVGPYSPQYSVLGDDMRGVIERVWPKFADLFDSPHGGPHLQFYFQTRFHRGRLAQLLRSAVGKLNTVAQPYQTYTVDDDNNPFPVAQWGALLEQALYVETVKHLIRSYVEQPAAEGIPTARLDRRDYMQRWQSVLEMETDDLDDMLDTFKISNMMLSSPRVLVSGGVYGNYGPTRTPGVVAQPRYWARFY